MRKIIFAMAALAALGMSSCQNDAIDEKIDNPVAVESGKPAGLALRFELPATAGTRAADEGPLNATTEESNVTSVDVFVFESNGAMAVEGGHSSLSAATDFTASGNVYTLKPTSYIETLSGAKRIYVALNLPATALKDHSVSGTVSLPSFSGTEDALLALFASIPSMSTDNTAGFTMFSNVNVLNLIPDEDLTDGVYEGISNNGGSNIVNTTVDRVVSKVATSTRTATYTNTWSDVEAQLTLVYTIHNFRVIQDAILSYVAPNYWTGTFAKTYPGIAPTPQARLLPTDPVTDNGLFNAYDVDAQEPAVAIGLNPTTDADIVAMGGFYVGENYPVSDGILPLALNGNTTYAMVTTTVTANMAAEWDPSANPNGDGTYSGGVIWNSVPLYGGTDPSFANDGTSTSTDIYVVSAGGKDYVTNTMDKASAIANGLGVGTPSDAPGEGLFVYTEGFVHFMTLLNREGTNDFAIARNQFVHVKIDDILSQDFLFPGYPGEEEDPDKPVPPTDKDPIDPVDGKKAYLSVTVTVNPWIYKENVTVLQ